MPKEGFQQISKDLHDMVLNIPSLKIHFQLYYFLD